MPISEVHTCWPPKYVHGLLDLSVYYECRGGRNAKTKILSLFMDWLQYEPNVLFDFCSARDPSKLAILRHIQSFQRRSMYA